MGRRRSRLALAGMFIFSCVLLAAHPVILKSVGSGLIADGDGSAADWAVIVEGDHCYDIVAQDVASGRTRGVLLLRDAPSRLVKYDILPSCWEVSLKQLTSRGVPRDAIKVLDKSVHDEWELAECIAAWADAHPDQHVVAVADRFASRTLRVLLDRFRHKTFVGVRALPDRRYNETNWWRSRNGIKSVLHAYLSLTYHWVSPVPAKHYVDDWDPDEYELSLQQGSRGRG